MLKYLLTAALVAALLMAWILTRPAAPRPYAQEYHAALDRFAGSTASVDAGLQRFESVYSDLTHRDVGRRMQTLYADPLYFNDSLKTIRQREMLVSYMSATGASLQESQIDIEHVLRDGRDVFVRWTMHFKASALGRPVESTSIGMTHLRFDAEGRIVLHQDFWDSAAGLYRNLPVIGYALQRVDRQMISAHVETE